MRKLRGILFSVIFFFAVVGTFAYFESAHLLARMIANKMGVSVSIESLAFSKNRFIINKLRMANPSQALLPAALKVEEIHVIAPYVHYMKNPITIDEIHLKRMYVDIEIYDKQRATGNWQSIIKHVHLDNTSSFTFKRETVIKKLLFSDITVDVVLPGGDRHRLPLIKKIEFKHVTTDKGIPIQEIVEIIVKKMIRSLLVQKALETIIEAPIDVLKGIFHFLDHLGEEHELSYPSRCS